MAAQHKKIVSFSEYKEMSDEIKGYFKPEFERLHDRISTLEKRIDNRIDMLEKRLDVRIDAIDEKFKLVFGLCGAILVAVIISIITSIFK